MESEAVVIGGKNLTYISKLATSKEKKNASSVPAQLYVKNGMILSSDATILQLSPIMASWFIPISFIKISQGEIFGNTSPHKYWKGFLSVKLRAKSNFKTLGSWSTKERGTEPTLRGNLFAFIISLFFMWAFKEIFVKMPCTVIHESSRWTPFPQIGEQPGRDKTPMQRDQTRQLPRQEGKHSSGEK